jgi:hypothetical protein
VSNHTTHQLVSRIFALFLKEVLNYDKDIYLVPPLLQGTDTEKFPEKTVEYSSLSELSDDESKAQASINLAVWRTADHQESFPETTFEGNSLFEQDIARYGLYIPSELIERNNQRPFNYHMFEKSQYEKAVVSEFVADKHTLQYLEGLKSSVNSKIYHVNDGIYEPHQCVSSSEPCALVLTSHYRDMNFFIRHIERFKLKMTLYFMGDRLKEAIVNLTKLIKNNPQKKKFLVLHWTPSEIISGSTSFDSVTMPPCEYYKDENTSCKFEANSVAIFFNKEVKDSELYNCFKNVKIDSMEKLIKNYYEPRAKDLMMEHVKINNENPDVYTSEEVMSEIDKIYNEIACDWLNDNSYVYTSESKRWFVPNEAIKITLGGM